MKQEQISRGSVYYNQEIPEDELWEDTLHRPDLKIIQLHRPEVGIELDTYSVHKIEIQNGKLITVDINDMKTDDIKPILSNYKY